MKNKIFKNYAKKILKSEAFVSVIIVFVLALGIIGSSYALYMDIDTDTDYQLVKVGDLSIGFNNGSDLVTLENITPTSEDIAIGKVASDDNISQKNLTSFYIYNTGTYTANYKINLRAIDGNQVETKFINYQICRDNADNCKDIGTLNESGDTTIYIDELTPNSTAIDTNNTNPSAYYFLRLWINDKYNGNNDAKTIKMQIIVEATNASGYLDNDNTLAGRILNDSRITINNNQPDFNINEINEVGIYKTNDDYGVSYYFRGKQPNNYVEFAGFIWRVVRINGDGSIRLILDKTLVTDEQCNDNIICTDSVFNSNYTSLNASVGYMYGDVGDSYDITHKNIHESDIKKKLDSFYEKYLINYDSYIADTMFCGDKSLKSGTGINNEETVYNGGLDTPTFECAKGELNNYSRYTSKKETDNMTEKSVLINNDLKYPIGLLSNDEKIMSGEFLMKHGGQ